MNRIMFMDRLKPGAAPFADSTAVAPPVFLPGSPEHTVAAVLRLLSARGIAYCIPDGAEGLPLTWGSDIDVIVARDVAPRDLLRLFDTERATIGAKVVRARGGFITFGCAGPDGLPRFVSFDFGHDYTAGTSFIASAETMLENRRRQGDLWVPAAAVSAATGLLRPLLRGKLDAKAAARISVYYAEAPAASREAFCRFLSPELAAEAISCASRGDWSPIIERAAYWQTVEASRIRRANMGSSLSLWMAQQTGRLRRVFRPDGFHVVLLGPDGAGKSSTIAALEAGLAPLFSRTEVKGFAPTLRQILKRRPSSTATPHALKPRSLPTSLLRAGWWSVFALASHVTLRAEKTRSMLVLNDRHFIDILVDPVRYRYGGPRWILKAVAMLMPRPDAIILLHGPAEVLQARKKELTVEETARQCRDYLALVSGLPNAHVIDATQPFAAVVADVTGIVLAKG